MFEARPDLADEARFFASRSHAKNTLRARASDWRVFAAWCARSSVLAAPAAPEDVAAFLTEAARTKATATVLRYAHSISSIHEAGGHASPVKHPAVKALISGIKNEKGVRPVQKDALTLDVLRASLPPPVMLGQIRDRAVLLFGFATALRRSNIVDVDVEDLTWSEQGIVVDVRRSKTDQRGDGARVAVPRVTLEPCPASAVRAWLDASGVASGPLFRGLRRGGGVRTERLDAAEVGKIVKRFAAAAGLDPRRFGGHSLRAGYVTTAREHDVDWATIMAQTGHKLLTTVKKYARYTPEVFDETRVADVFKSR